MATGFTRRYRALPPALPNREYPKYGMVSRYFVYKQALMEKAERLEQARVLRDREDIFYLTFPELQEVVRTREVDEHLIQEARTSSSHTKRSRRRGC